eukprot:CAMPEP_0178433846 /NCGR_PEP_ID=MMETSP0689_2-20121128/33118_1 /TAXON_ID=160604 /ORGANISM="Amphidinium massartii, Strain CS-259" /LENGTH=33 /DNA_ID= /DNA_START= /DNA_END= /DNA_ORIENTATION=
MTVRMPATLRLCSGLNVISMVILQVVEPVLKLN